MHKIVLILSNCPRLSGDSKIGLGCFLLCTSWVFTSLQGGRTCLHIVSNLSCDNQLTSLEITSSSNFDISITMNLVTIIWRSLIATVGMVTNIIVFVTYCRKKRLGHIQCIILILAVSDILGCVVLITVNITDNLFGAAYCYFAPFALACTSTFSLFLSAYVPVDRYKAHLHIGIPTSTSNKKTVMICLSLGIIAILVTAPVFYFIDNEDMYSTCIKPIAHNSGVKLLVFQLKNLVAVVIIIIYNTKIFLLARKRQNLITPQSNMEQPESNPQYDDNQWAQHMRNQQNPLELANITSLFLASDLQPESSVSHEASTSSHTAHTSFHEASTSTSSCAAHNSKQQVTNENFALDVMNLKLNVPSIIDNTETDLPSVKLEMVDNDSQTVQYAKSSSSTALSTIQEETDEHTYANAHDNPTQVFGVTTIETDAHTNANAQDNPTQEFGITAFTHVTKMLFCVNVVAVVTQLSFLVMASIWFPHVFQLQEQNKALYIFCQMLRDLNLVNFATNPILYCIINKSFRLDCKAATHQITRL